MWDAMNILLALATVAFGAIALFAPRWAMDALDLRTGDTTMGVSELRASAGGGFVTAGLAAIWIGSPTAYLMLGCLYVGLAIGRLASILLDNPPPKARLFFAIEAVFAAGFLIANL